MKTTFQRKGFASLVLFLCLTWTLCLWSADHGWAQDKAVIATDASPQTDNFLDLRGDVPNPQRIDPVALHKLPRVEIRVNDPRDAGKEIVYSGTPLVEVLKTGGLLLNAGEAGIRESVKMTVFIEAVDGYRVAFSLAELDPELTDRIVLLADARDGRPLSPHEGPFRIIVPQEKRPTRWVRQVKSVTVRQN
jgi:DMSO/TMAO reductase YedYZ molybdopterin-dependent catalytic subunit